MMRLLILLAFCVAASQARSTQSGSRMKLLSRVLDFLEEREDDPVPECECPTGEQVVDFLATHAHGSESEESIERPDGVCELDTCDGLEEEIGVALVDYLADSGCECPERPEPGAGRPDPADRPENACPRPICFALNGGPPGGRSGPRGGGSRGPPSGEDDDDKRHARRDEDGDICLCPLGPGEEPHPEDAGFPPCMNGECDESPESPEDSADDDKRHARRDESCECRPPPPPGAGPPPADAPPPCPQEDCPEPESEPEEDSSEERRASSLKTRALVNLLKSLLHKK